MVELKTDQQRDALRALRTAWPEDRLERLWQGSQRKSVRRERLVRAAQGTLAVACVLVAVNVSTIWGAFSQASNTAHVQQAGATLTFDDGSVARALDAEAELVVRTSEPDEVEIALTHGAGQFRVAPNSERQFRVRAGQVLVTVIGTEFSVEEKAGRARVEVTRGVVRVSWNDGDTVLRAGDSGWYPPGGGAETASRPGAPVPLTPPEGVETEPKGDLPEPVPSPGKAPSVRESYQRYAKKKAFDDAFKLLTKNPDLAGRSAGELMLAADVARGAGQIGQAMGYLSRVVNEHAGDPQAALAAFTLGRLAVGAGRHAAAAGHFLKARSLAPSGPLAEYSLAREVEARALAGQTGPAQALARQYLKLYPKGQRRGAVRRHARLPQRPR